MPQHAKRIKLRRKDLRQPDEFETLTGQLVDWASTHQVLLAGVVAGVLVVGGSALAIRYWWSAQASRAATEFDAAIQSLEAGRPGATQAFGLVAENYPGTPSGGLARLYRAHALLRQGDAAGAVTAYGEYLAAGRATPYLQQEALVALGHAREATGSNGGALEAYTQASEFDGPFQQDALLGMARLQEASGHAEEARRTYARVLEAVGSTEGGAADDLRAFLARKVPPGTTAAKDAAAAPGANVR